MKERIKVLSNEYRWKRECKNEKCIKEGRKESRLE